MALYRRGDSGEPVRDIQDRLVALGYDTSPDPPGTFGQGTESAVLALQKAYRLTEDGLVGRETWRTLVDAGYSLGDRLLYYRMPMLHGDDVAELQRRLNALGFDAGDVDGIFGPETLRAVLDFQHNRLLAEDGIVGPLMVAELALMSRATAKIGRYEVRERQWHMTPRKLLFHLLLHEIRHWAQIAMAVRIAGLEPPGDHDLFFSAALR